MGKVIDFAERRMLEEDAAGDVENTRYWAAYIDGAKAQLKEDTAKKPVLRLAAQTEILCERIRTYAQDMDNLAADAMDVVEELTSGDLENV